MTVDQWGRQLAVKLDAMAHPDCACEATSILARTPTEAEWQVLAGLTTQAMADAMAERWGCPLEQAAKAAREIVEELRPS